MSIQAHIDSLSKKRIQVKDQITVEMNHPSPNFETITKLKKQNLALKEEMQRYIVTVDKAASA